MENYEQKYKEALERAKGFYEAFVSGHSYPAADIKASYESIFPELKESEDEKIRKEIIGHFKRGIEVEFPELEEKYNTWIAWLEKQGKRKPAEWSEEDKDHVKSLLIRLRGLCRNKFIATRFAINEDEDWLKSLKVRYRRE